jgi:multidrug efflux pump subunit AcrB
MFRPLAWTKTLAVGFSSLLAITLVPVLMLFFIRGRLRPESRNPLSIVTPGSLSSSSAFMPSLSQNHFAAQSNFSCCHTSAGPEDWQPVYAAAI